MKNKYLEFEKIQSKTKTKVYIIYIKDGYYSIGKIKYYSGWRKYCFYSSGLTIINPSCLEEIVNFLDKLNKLRKENDNND